MSQSMSKASMSNNPMVNKRLEGKVAVITGGASGIGEATTRLFVKHGAKVVIADVQDDLGRVVSESLGSHVTYVHCDVTLEPDVERAVDLAVSKYGKLDIMFNNAGISGDMETRILHSDGHNFKRVNDVLVYGGFLGAKHAARVMIPAKKGCILFTSSIASVLCGDCPYGYAAAKHAVVGMAKHLSAELGRHRIRVNCVSPFIVATPMLMKGMGFTEKEKVEEAVASAATLKGTILEVEDVAEAALYLVSDESKYVTGINLVIDGGYSLVNSTVTVALKNLISESS